jgi:hypothetical protein
VRTDEAKEVLLLYRPGTTDTADPQLAAALELARTDPELGRWFEEHRAFQKAMSAKFRQIEVPAHLKSSLLIRGTAPVQLPAPRAWWRSPVWLTAAAAALVLLAVVGFWPKPQAQDRFANYKARMVTEAQRAEYRMDLVTNDMRQVRQLMANGGAPADYDVPQGLEHLQLTGGALLTWRSQPVAMVCFDRGDKQMLFLFVMKRSAVKDPPPQAPDLAKVSKLLTVSWTRGDKTYILAGPDEAGFVKKYL